MAPFNLYSFRLTFPFLGFIYLLFSSHTSYYEMLKATLALL